MDPLLAARAPSSRKAKNKSQSAMNDVNSNSNSSSEKSELALGGEGLRRRRRDTSGREYDEVDDRIMIPLANSNRNSSQQLGGSGSAGGIAGLHNHKIGVSVSTSASSGSGAVKSESILQSGISKYRSLSGKTQQQQASSTAKSPSSSGGGAKSTAASSSSSSSSSSTAALVSTVTSTTTTTTTAAASTTSSPTIIIPGASLKVHMEDSRMAQSQRNKFFSSSSSSARNHHLHSVHQSNATVSPSTRHQQPHRRDVLSIGSSSHSSMDPYDRGKSLMDQKQFAAAIPYFTDALASSSSNGGGSIHQSQRHVHYMRGTCYLQAQKYNHAIEDFTRVITLTPKNPELFAKRAKAYASLNQHHAALSDYNEAINLSATPNSASYTVSSLDRAKLRSLYLARSRVYNAINNVTNALDDLAKAENADGYRDAELYYQRAYLYIKRHEEELALKDFDRFLELHDEVTTHHEVVDSASVMGGYGSSTVITTASSAAIDEAHERMQEVLLDRAKLLQRLAAQEDAQQRKDVDLLAIEEGGVLVVSSSAAAAAASRSEKNSSRRASGYRSAEAIALVLRAIKDYTLLLEADPANTETLRRRGEAYGSIGRYDDALKDFDLAHRLEPHDFEVSIARAKLYQQQSDLQKAIDEMTTVLKVNGFFIDALFFRASLYELVGDVTKAQRDYTSVIEAHYDLRGESYSDAGNATNVTEKTPLLSKASNSNSSSNSKPNAKSPQTAVKPAKITSEYSAKALVLRARLSVQTEKFDDAIADYERILASFPNHLEAQLELPEARTQKVMYEEKVHRDAVAWLEKEEQEKQLEAAGGADGKKDGAALATGTKKKKKKKAKKKKRPTQSGYVLLEDDEDENGTFAPDTVATADVTDSADGGGHESQSETGNAQQREVAAEVPVVPVVVAKKSVESSQDQPIQEEPSKAAAAVVERSPVVAVMAPPRAVVSRDEACESMWEQSDDQADSAEETASLKSEERMRMGKPVVGDSAHNKAEKSDQPVSENGSKSSQQDEEGESTADDRDDDDKDGSATDLNTNSTLREVIVDEKYLRKRQRQLENLRGEFLQVCEARDKSGIEEVLERAERKQMTESLSDEIGRAKAVLESLESLENGELAEEVVVEATVAHSGAETRTETTVAAVAEEPTSVKSADVAVPAVATTAREEDSKPIIATETAPVAPQQKRTHRHSQTTIIAPTEQDQSSVANSASKPPSLVIRPIAYGQALQLAEQSQNLFLQNQRLLQEKDAEIASLRQLLAQSRRQATIERFDDAVDDDLSSRLASLRHSFPHKQLRGLEKRVDVLVNWMGPNDDADLTRRKILAFVHRVLEAANFALGTPILVFPTGSFPMKTYLPTADLDVCLLLPKELEQTWYFPVMHALCLAGSSNNGVDGGGGGGSLNGSPNPKLSATAGGSAGSAAGGLNSYASSATNTVRNVNFINADVRVIKCTIDNISVDFTANRVGALGALLLLDSMDTRVGRDHLLKKSLILIKAWCIHESSAYTAAPHGSPSQPQTTGASASSPAGHSVLGASYGAFSTYAINTVVMGLFNQYGATITHPLQALFLFLDRMAEFPWHEAAMTLHGPVGLSALAASSSLSNAMKKNKKQNGRGKGDNGGSGELHSAKISFDDVEQIRLRTQEQFGGFDASSSSASNGFKVSMFPIRVCNIVDPLDEKNNLARSVSVDWFPSMKRAFRLGRNRLGQLLMSKSSSLFSSSSASFSAEASGGPSKLDEVDDFFVNSWRSYGRGDGWRPDLLVHPRQVWHGKAPSGGEQNEDTRWQSLLPEFVPMSVNSSLYQPQGAMYQQQQQAQQYVPHHHQQQQHMQNQSPHHYHHQQQHQHVLNNGVPGALMGSEPLSYSQHRRSFDNKSSPLKTTTTVRQQSSPGPAGMYNSGGGSGIPHSHSKPAATRRYDSPPYATGSK